MPGHRENQDWESNSLSHDTQHGFAAVLLGLMIHAVDEMVKQTSSTYNPAHLEPLSPLVNALRRTCETIDPSSRLYNDMLPKCCSYIGLEEGYHFFRQLVIDDHKAPTTQFHRCLFSQILQEPVVRDALSWLRHPGLPHPDTRREVDLFLYTLFRVLTPSVEKALTDYLKHHAAVTLGFREEAASEPWRLVGTAEHDEFELRHDEASNEIRLRRKRLAQQLVIPLLGLATAPPEKTLQVWALGGGKKKGQGGWVSVNRNFRNVLFQILLGPALKPDSDLRSSGAIVQGLIHWFFVYILKFPLKTDAHVAYIKCPEEPEPAMLPYTTFDGQGYLICPQCRKGVDLTSHRIIYKRHNIAGDGLNKLQIEENSALASSQAQGCWTWTTRKLYACPPSRPRPQSIEAAIVAVGAEWKQFIDEERHLVFSNLSSCPLLLSLTDPHRKIIHGYNPSYESNPYKPSSRESSLYFRVVSSDNLPIDDEDKTGESMTDPDREAALIVSSNERDADENNKIILDDKAVEALASCVLEAYKATRRNRGAAAIWMAMRLTDKTCDDEDILRVVSTKLFVFMEIWGHAKAKQEVFEQNADSDLQTLWYSLSQMHEGKPPFKNQRQMTEALVALIEDVADRISSETDE